MDSPLPASEQHENDRQQTMYIDVVTIHIVIHFFSIS